MDIHRTQTWVCKYQTFLFKSLITKFRAIQSLSKAKIYNWCRVFMIKQVSSYPSQFFLDKIEARHQLGEASAVLSQDLTQLELLKVCASAVWCPFPRLQRLLLLSLSHSFISTSSCSVLSWFLSQCHGKHYRHSEKLFGSYRKAGGLFQSTSDEIHCHHVNSIVVVLHLCVLRTQQDLS